MDVKICIGSACHIKGSPQVIAAFQKLLKIYDLEDQVELKAVFCLGHCTEAVSVQLDDEAIYSVSEDTVETFIKQHIIR